MTNYSKQDYHPENVAGDFRVNDQCIICDLCFEIAPETFRTCDDGSQSIVFCQPQTEAERELAEEALADCPVGAIER